MHQLLLLQVCPVDLTRSMSNMTSMSSLLSMTGSSSTATNKRLAFSVENILDPNKFTGHNKGQTSYSKQYYRHWSNVNCGCSDEALPDDERSENMSGE